MLSRSCGSWPISWKKPWPSPSPSRLAVGTRTSLKNSSEVSCADWRACAGCGPRSKPSASSVSTKISEVAPRAPGSDRSCDDADQVGGLAVGDEGLLAVDDVLVAVPSEPSSLTPCRSEPAPGSVMAMAVTISPVQIFGSQRRRWSSVP
jgi:hypothetical protein